MSQGNIGLVQKIDFEIRLDVKYNHRNVEKSGFRPSVRCLSALL